MTGLVVRTRAGTSVAAAVTALFVPGDRPERFAKAAPCCIANARLRTMNEFSAYPQLADRDRWQDVDSPVGPLRSLIPPVTSRATGFRMGPVPDVGEHTDAVLAELGLGPATITESVPAGRV
jgi:itaconate CoA-transferase